MKSGELSWLTTTIDLLPSIILLVATVVGFIGLLLLLRKIHNWQHLTKQKLIFLSVTPSIKASRSARANTELINIIYGLNATRSRKDKLKGRIVVLPLEITASREQGIRFIIPVEPKLAKHVTQAIVSFMPDAKVSEITDYLPSDYQDTQVSEYRLQAPWQFPLSQHHDLIEHDPVAYLTGAMSKLESGEQITLQLVSRPIKIKESATILHRIIRNEDVLSHSKHTTLPIVTWLLKGINTILFGVLDIISGAWHAPSKAGMSTYQRQQYDRQQVARHIKPARTLSTFEQEQVEAMKAKVSQPLFSVSIRAAITTNRGDEQRGRRGMISASLESYTVPGYQAIKPKLNLPFTQRYRQYVFRKRLPNFFRGTAPVLSASEVASLYHFPVGGDNKTDNLVTSLSRTLPAPLSLKQAGIFDVVFGENQHHGTMTPIGLSADERARHAYVIGGTGNGKTTMLQYAIMQDIHDDRGVAVIDPHGDLSQTILKHIPEHRMKDVVYFNPDDLDYPIGLNLLEIDSNLTGNDLLREQDRITESVVSVFRKIFSDEDAGGHRIEYVLRNAILTALTVPDATLFTVLKLLQNTQYRKKIAERLEDQSLKDFWLSDMGQAGNMQRVKMSLGVTSKISRFHASASARLILEQPKSSIDFEDIMNSGKILICNFAKGALGEDTAQLFGIATLAKIQLAAYRRVHMDEQDRRPFYLYVDEFQNFATTSFEQMLSESRKYKLSITMAEQSMAQQQDQQMVKVILANVGTVICFKTGNSEDERVLLPRFKPFLQEGDIQHLPAYNFFADLSAIKSQEPTSGVTVLLPNTGDKERAQEVIRLSREQYGRSEPLPRPVHEIEEATTQKTQNNTKQRKTSAKSSNKNQPAGRIYPERKTA